MGSAQASRELPSRIAHPLVVIFGAGASKGGLSNNPDTPAPPVDVDFFDVANRLEGHGTPTYARRVLKSVWQLYGRVEGITLEEYYRDIETRAAIARIAKSVNRPKDWQRKQKELEELIRRVYAHTTADFSARSPAARTSEPHQTILRLLKDDSTIVTFNYDLVIEESFESAALWNPKDGYGVRVYGSTLDWCRKWLKERDYRKGDRSRVSLLKLHGSLGWTLYKNKDIRLKPRPYCVRKGKVEQVSILPPGWHKEIGHNPYRKFWYKARRKLEECSSLIIVGYSLPETDLLAKALFAEVIRLRVTRNRQLKQLILVDPSPDVRDKFIRMFTPTLGPTGRVFKVGAVENLCPPKDDRSTRQDSEGGAKSASAKRPSAS